MNLLWHSVASHQLCWPVSVSLNNHLRAGASGSVVYRNFLKFVKLWADGMAGFESIRCLLRGCKLNLISYAICCSLDGYVYLPTINGPELILISDNHSDVYEVRILNYYWPYVFYTPFLSRTCHNCINVWYLLHILLQGLLMCNLLISTKIYFRNSGLFRRHCLSFGRPDLVWKKF